jgi:23S rRNA pseudouridine2605 synthase
MAKEFKRSGNKDNRGNKPFTKKAGGRDSRKPNTVKRSEDKHSSEDEIKPRKSASKREQKPVFERFRDDSRPSEFGSGKGRRTGAGETKERSARPAFKKEAWSKDKKTPFAFKGKRKPFDKNKFSDKPDFKRKDEAINPYDLDESDFEHKTVAEEFRTPKKGGKKRPAAAKEQDGLIRLNKYIANAGICSRREADTLISTGVVQVNGKTITEMGYKVKPTDIIKYGGQTLRKERLVYLILNKPKDYITTVDDPQERRTVLELIHGACKERVYPVGRLDRATTGLLMFTNDGELTKKLTHPRYGVRKIYHVELDKPLKRTDMDKITEGIELEDGPIKVDEITYVGDGADKAQIGVELHSGKNRIVRRIFEAIGYNVRKLDRVMFGPLTKKDLPRGRWRLLTEAEVGMLKMISGD